MEPYAQQTYRDGGDRHVILPLAVYARMQRYLLLVHIGHGRDDVRGRLLQLSQVPQLVIVSMKSMRSSSVGLHVSEDTLPWPVNSPQRCCRSQHLRLKAPHQQGWRFLADLLVHFAVLLLHH